MSECAPDLYGDDIDLVLSSGQNYPELDLRPPLTFEQSMIAETPAMKAPEIRRHLHELVDRVDFHEREANMRLVSDVIGLTRKVAGGVETYADKLRKEEAKGKQEVASVGLAKIGDQEVVLSFMDWDFFAGSLGMVAGEKFILASDIAARKKLPLIAVFSSSGVRQHENTAGLLQMYRMTNAVRRFQDEGHAPYVAVLLGQVWGGVSASVVPQADMTVAYKGTEYGFSGPNVIAAYEGKEVERGGQRAELHAMQRNVDVIVDDTDELLTFLSGVLSSTSNEKHPKLSEDQIINVPVSLVKQERTDQSKPRIVHGISVSSPSNVDTIEIDTIEPSHTNPSPEELYEWYNDIARSAERPDAEFFMQHVFTDVTPLYNRFETDKLVRYPNIIAALGKLAGQPFIILGNQPSYQITPLGMRRVPSGPGPEDYRYKQRIMQFGKRLHLPMISICDTLGARPTLDAERNDQMGWIADALMDNTRYPYPSLTVITGALGSGGGLSSAPWADHISMLSKSLAFVAEPRSSASILYKKPDVRPDEVRDVLASMRATAADQLDMGIIDEVISESDNNYVTAARVHNALLRAYVGVQDLSQHKLESRRDQRLDKLTRALMKAEKAGQHRSIKDVLHIPSLHRQQV